MLLFADKKNIFKSLLLCADALIKSKSLMKLDYKELDDMQSIKWQRIQDVEFEVIAIIFSIYHSKLIRKETINKYISKCNFNDCLHLNVSFCNVCLST